MALPFVAYAQFLCLFFQLRHCLALKAPLHAELTAYCDQVRKEMECAAEAENADKPEDLLSPEQLRYLSN